MSWLDRVKRKLAGKTGAGERDLDESEAPEVGDGQCEVSIAALLEEGWLWDQEGDLKRADRVFTKAIERGQNADAYYGRGVVRCKLSRYPAAIVDLNEAIKLRPRFPSALTERGLAYVEGGEVEKAIQEYDAAIEIDPSYGVAHSNKGAACLMLERWAQAIPHLDIALRLDPSHAIARYNRGIAHEMLDDLSRARRDYQDAVVADPKGPFASHAAGRLNALKRGTDDRSTPEWPAPKSLWTEMTALSLEDTVGDLVQKVHAEGAFFGMVALQDGRRLLVPIFGRDGIRQYFTEVADVIGPQILTLKLGQFDALLPQPPGEISSQRETEGEVLVAGRELRLITNGEQILGVFSGRFDYHYPDLPTVLFGESPIFERSDSAGSTRQCSSCARDIAYFNAILEDEMLVDFACPSCGQEMGRSDGERN